MAQACRRLVRTLEIERSWVEVRDAMLTALRLVLLATPFLAAGPANSTPAWRRRVGGVLTSITLKPGPGIRLGVTLPNELTEVKLALDPLEGKRQPTIIETDAGAPEPASRRGRRITLHVVRDRIGASRWPLTGDPAEHDQRDPEGRHIVRRVDGPAIERENRGHLGSTVCDSRGEAACAPMSVCPGPQTGSHSTFVRPRSELLEQGEQLFGRGSRHDPGGEDCLSNFEYGISVRGVHASTLACAYQGAYSISAGPRSASSPDTIWHNPDRVGG